MCLFIKSGPHVATRDIPVFKIIFNTNTSDHRGFSYTPNRTYVAHTPIIPYPTYHREENVINEGFHAYLYEDVTKIKQVLKGWPPKRHIVVQFAGEFSDFLRVDEFGALSQKLVAFTIPKGAKYYLGKNSDIVASSIRSGSLKPMRPRDLKRKRTVKGRLDNND